MTTLRDGQVVVTELLAGGGRSEVLKLSWPKDLRVVRFRAPRGFERVMGEMQHTANLCVCVIAGRVRINRGGPETTLFKDLMADDWDCIGAGEVVGLEVLQACELLLIFTPAEERPIGDYYL